MTSDYWYLNSIRDAVNSPQTADPESLRDAAVAYSDACRDANRRLRDVERLLRGGLRNEAVQLADEEPRLLEHVGELDLAITEDWQGMVAQWGMDVPPELEVGIAAELNVAYAELMPLENLMRQHRLLAIARAPLSARLRVLRQIADQDEMNQAWQLDLADYEDTRLRQIKRECKDASHREDLAAVQAIHEELRQSNWTIDVPGDLLAEVEKVLQQELQRDARNQLRKLAADLHQAYVQFEILEASAIADRWQEVLPTANLATGDTLLQEVEEALSWVENEKEASEKQRAFDNALANLEAALDERAPHDRLETLWLKAERFGQPIPDLLSQRVRQRLIDLQLQSRRKVLTVGVAATLVTVLIAAGVVFFWMDWQRRTELQAHLATLESMEEEKEWKQIEGYVDKLPEGTRSRADVNAYLSKAEKRLKTEAERAELVDGWLTKAEAMDPANPDFDLIEKIKEKAELPEEENRLSQVQLKINGIRREDQNKRNTAFMVTFEKWSVEVQLLENLPSLQDVNLRAKLKHMEADFKQHTGVTYELAEKAEALKEKMQAMIKEQLEEAVR